MKISFHDEAYETFQRHINILEGYCVNITLQSDLDPTWETNFDAKLVGPDHDSEWGNAILVQRWDEDASGGKGDTFSVRAAEIEVY